jgi:hypothetical protein
MGDSAFHLGHCAPSMIDRQLFLAVQTAQCHPFTSSALSGGFEVYLDLNFPS